MEHSFNVAIANRFGMLGAVLVSNLNFWIKKNMANGAHFHDGRYWTYNSMSAFAELFQYATESQIRYALKKLRDEGILMTGNFSPDMKSRTLWYAFTDKGNKMLENPEAFFAMEDDKDGQTSEDLASEDSVCQQPQVDLLTLTNASANSSKCIC